MSSSGEEGILAVTDEVLQHVFSYLDDLDDVISVSHSCNKFLQISSSDKIWKRFSITSRFLELNSYVDTDYNYTERTEGLGLPDRAIPLTKEIFSFQAPRNFPRSNYREFFFRFRESQFKEREKLVPIEKQLKTPKCSNLTVLYPIIAFLLAFFMLIVMIVISVSISLAWRDWFKWMMVGCEIIVLISIMLVIFVALLMVIQINVSRKQFILFHIYQYYIREFRHKKVDACDEGIMLVIFSVAMLIINLFIFVAVFILKGIFGGAFYYYLSIYHILSFVFLVWIAVFTCFRWGCVGRKLKMIVWGAFETWHGQEEFDNEALCMALGIIASFATFIFFVNVQIVLVGLYYDQILRVNIFVVFIPTYVFWILSLVVSVPMVVIVVKYYAAFDDVMMCFKVLSCEKGIMSFVITQAIVTMILAPVFVFGILFPLFVVLKYSVVLSFISIYVLIAVLMAIAPFAARIIKLEFDSMLKVNDAVVAAKP